MEVVKLYEKAEITQVHWLSGRLSSFISSQTARSPSVDGASRERSRADAALSAGLPPAPPALWRAGVCSEQGSPLTHCRGTWPRLSLGFLVRRGGPRAGFSVGSLWAFPREMPSGQVAGGRAHPVPRMSPGVTSSYLCGCGVSPQPLPSSPIFIVLWEAPQKTGCRQAVGGLKKIGREFVSSQ